MSVAADLLTALKARLATALPAYAVEVRKTPTRVDDDPAALAVLTLGADDRRPAYGQTWCGLWVTYPVAVTLSRKQAVKLTGTALADDRQAATRALGDLRGLAAGPLPALDRLTFQGRPFYGAAAAKTGFDLTSFQYLYVLKEPR